MLWVFWTSVAFVAYVYVGYPLLARWWATRRTRARRTAGWKSGDASQPPDSMPGVSIVIAARNEAAHLPARLDNLLQQEYPADRRQIIVVSDGSSDETLAVLERYRPSVEVVELPPGGKAVALNAGVARAVHGLLIFADARQTFGRGALAELVAPFRDPQVGGVTGELRLDCESTDADASIGEGVGLYWRYEKAIRRSESAIDSTLGATGAIYALRRSLWQPLPADTILDDVLAPMRAVLGGFRIVFNDRAPAFDRAAASADAELRRKIRTLAGNVQILWLEPRLLLPWRNRVWLQYASHKIARLLVPYALLAAFASSEALARQSLVYGLALAVQVAFVLLAGYGGWLDRRSSARRRERGAARSPVGRTEEAA